MGAEEWAAYAHWAGWHYVDRGAELPPEYRQGPPFEVTGHERIRHVVNGVHRERPFVAFFYEPIVGGPGDKEFVVQGVDYLCDLLEAVPSFVWTT